MMALRVVSVVVSTDHQLYEEFESHSSTMQRQGLIELHPVQYADDANNVLSLWSDIRSADIVLVFQSPKLLATLYRYEKQGITQLVDALWERRNSGSKPIPVNLRPCSWDDPGQVCHRLKSLPPQDKGYITEYRDRDGIWLQVIGGLRGIVANRKNPVVPAKATQVVTPPQCGYCQALLDPDSLYCPDCGSKVGQVQSQPRSRPIGVLPIYAFADFAFAKEFRAFLEAPGIAMKVFDPAEVIAGGTLPGWVQRHLKEIDAVLYLCSSDLIAYANRPPDPTSILSQGLHDIPDTLLKKSYKIVLRPCVHDAFLPKVPNTLFGAGGKVFSKLSVADREESYMMLAQRIKNDLQ